MDVAESEPFTHELVDRLRQTVAELREKVRESHPWLLELERALMHHAGWPEGPGG